MHMSELVVSPEFPRAIHTLAWLITLFVLGALSIEVVRCFRPSPLVALDLQAGALADDDLAPRHTGEISVHLPGEERRYAVSGAACSTIPMNLVLLFCPPGGMYQKKLEFELIMPREAAQHFRGAMIGHGPQRIR
jgi:hypothetical protein